VKGRKLHTLVDTEGLPLRVVVHSAGIQDRDGVSSPPCYVPLILWFF
jgi:hypothetical protein